MHNELDMPYQYQGYLPGAFVELYLPKKAMYQGILYEALTEGFDFEKVKKHFEDPANSRRIDRLLKTYSEVKNIRDRIDQIEPFYWGYSMYEVDGVFFDPEKGISEERTQIVRMMFLPNMKSIRRLVPHIEYNDLRRLVKKIIKADSDEREQLKQTYPALIDYLNKWIGDVGLFLFGYVVFKLCARIHVVNRDNEEGLEKEIWLTSFWTLEVNKIELANGVNLE